MSGRGKFLHVLFYQNDGWCLFGSETYDTPEEAYQAAKKNLRGGTQIAVLTVTAETLNTETVAVMS